VKARCDKKSLRQKKGASKKGGLGVKVEDLHHPPGWGRKKNIQEESMKRSGKGV